MDWLYLLEGQGTLKSLLQHHSSKSINSSALSFLHSPTLTSIHLAASEPTVGSVSASAISASPEAAGGSQRSLTSSVPFLPMISPARVASWITCVVVKSR